jgi:hypothetical protein
MTDILLQDEAEQDLAFDMAKGDFALGESEGQHILLLLDTTKGDWTQNLLVGVGAKRWINGRLDARFEREVRLQLEADGLTNLDIEIEGSNVFINRQ